MIVLMDPMESKSIADGGEKKRLVKFSIVDKVDSNVCAFFFLVFFFLVSNRDTIFGGQGNLYTCVNVYVYVYVCV